MSETLNEATNNIFVEETICKVFTEETDVIVSVETTNVTVEIQEGFNGNASHIKGIYVSDMLPSEGEALIYTDGEYVPGTVSSSSDNVFTSKIVTLLAMDISNGYISLTPKAFGEAGEKVNVELTPIGGPDQEYGVDYTAMNNDAGSALIIIFKTVGEVAGITSAAYPSVGLMSKLESGDKIKITYQS